MIQELTGCSIVDVNMLLVFFTYWLVEYLAMGAGKSMQGWVPVGYAFGLAAKDGGSALDFSPDLLSESSYTQ